jgi:AcrR family transcriptional regulator
VPRRVDHDERRRFIVEALWRLAERGGLSAVTYREVAREARVSVRFVQYYFPTRADMLRAALEMALQLMGRRLTTRLLALMDGDSAVPPGTVVRTLVREFLPTDDESRRAMLLYYVFYAAQMTDPALRGVGEVPTGFVELVADQIRRGQDAGGVDGHLDPQMEGALLLAIVPGAASGVLAGYTTLDEATAMVDYAVDRIFGPA